MGFIIIIEILKEPAQSPRMAFTTEFSTNDLIPWLVVAVLSFCSQVIEDVVDSSWSSAKWGDEFSSGIYTSPRDQGN